MQVAPSRIWTYFTQSHSYHDNRHTRSPTNFIISKMFTGPVRDAYNTVNVSSADG